MRHPVLCRSCLRELRTFVAAVAALAAGAALALAGASPAHAGGPYTPSPTDWRDQSIYQIVVDRFYNGDPSNDGIRGSFDPSAGDRSHGGDWAGIEMKLDYIQGLGATAIWISPVQLNAYAAYHGYHIQDFYDFAPQFGGLTALRSLIDEMHARGMYVILDVIANHGGDLIDSGDPGWPSYQPGGGYTLRWRDPGNRMAPPFDDLTMYHTHGNISDFNDPEQILGELFGLDDLKTELPSIRTELIDAHNWLIEQTDADGFRIDTVKHVELDFWPEFCSEVRAYAADSLGKAEFFQFGEVFEGSTFRNGLFTGTMAGGDFALDSTLEYPTYFSSRWIFRDGGTPAQFTQILADSSFYEPSAFPRRVHFLDNHDNGRFQGFGSGADRDDAKAAAALGWMHATLGIPCVYYGMEQEFDGGGDPWNREDMWDGQWDFGPSEGDNFDQTTPLYREIRHLNEVRAWSPALRRGSIVDVFAEPGGPGLYAFRREASGADPVLVAVNNGGGAVTETIATGLSPGTYTDALSGREITVPAGGTISLTMPAHATAWFTANPPALRPWVAATWPPHDGTMREASAGARITFDQPMTPATVEAALSISPTTPHTLKWIDAQTLVVVPTGGWASGRTRIEVAGSAAAQGGLLTENGFAFEFDLGAPSPSYSAAAGYTVNPIPDDDVIEPRAIESGQGDEQWGRRVLITDEGRDRIYTAWTSGFVRGVVPDDELAIPIALALDAPDGPFGGDLLFVDGFTVKRYRRDGASGGTIELVAGLPSSATDWAMAIDRHDSGYPDGAYLGRTGYDDLVRVDPTSGAFVFASGFGDIRGIAFEPAGAPATFGGGMFVLGSGGTIWRVAPDGSKTVFATSPSLTNAKSLAFDGRGAFGGDLLTAGNGNVYRISSGGTVSVLASGFAGFPGADALAVDAQGDLWVVESNGGGEQRLVVVVADDPDSVTAVEPVPAVSAGLQRVAPNPYTNSVSIAFVVPDDGIGAVPVELTVYDVTGRVVATLFEGTRAPGAYEVTWDGRSDAGGRLAEGVRFLRLRAGARTYVEKVVAR